MMSQSGNKLKTIILSIEASALAPERLLNVIQQKGRLGFIAGFLFERAGSPSPLRSAAPMPRSTCHCAPSLEQVTEPAVVF
jgi:hypothetical protein